MVAEVVVEAEAEAAQQQAHITRLQGHVQIHPGTPLVGEAEEAVPAEVVVPAEEAVPEVLHNHKQDQDQTHPDICCWEEVRQDRVHTAPFQCFLQTHLGMNSADPEVREDPEDHHPFLYITHLFHE